MGFTECKYCRQKIMFSKTVISKNQKMIPLNEDSTPHNCPNRLVIDKSEFREYPVTFERASDLRDRELIEVSRNQINEVNKQLVHSRIEIIVRPKAKPEVTL